MLKPIAFPTAKKLSDLFTRIRPGFKLDPHNRVQGAVLFPDNARYSKVPLGPYLNLGSGRGALSVDPTPELVAYCRDQFCTDPIGESLSFKITDRKDDGTALLSVQWNNIIASRWLAVLPIPVVNDPWNNGPIPEGPECRYPVPSGPTANWDDRDWAVWVSGSCQCETHTAYRKVDDDNARELAEVTAQIPMKDPVRFQRARTRIFLRTKARGTFPCAGCNKCQRGGACCIRFNHHVGDFCLHCGNNETAPGDPAYAIGGY